MPNYSKINDVTKFPVRTSAEENGKSPKFVGYDDDGNIAMRANELVTRGATDDLANIQTLLGIPDQARRSATYVINGIDLTTGATIHTVPLPSGKTFIIDSVVILITDQDTWTVAGDCEAGFTLAADPDANRNDWSDALLNAIPTFNTETFRPTDGVNPKDSTNFDMLYFRVGVGATATSLVGTVLFNGYEIDTPA